MGLLVFLVAFTNPSTPSSVNQLSTVDVPVSTPEEFVEIQDYDVALSRLCRTAPKTAGHIKRLYSEYNQEFRSYTGNSSLQQYIYRCHVEIANHYHPCNPYLSISRVRLYEYSLRKYSEKYNISLPIFIKMTAHEYGFVNWYTTRTSKGYKLPKRLWSWGPWQVQRDTLIGHLKAIGCSDAEQLTFGDMLTFPLMNADTSAAVLSYYYRQDQSYKNALQKYNGGPNGWKDGRALPYYYKVSAVDLSSVEGLW